MGLSSRSKNVKHYCKSLLQNAKMVRFVVIYPVPEDIVSLFCKREKGIEWNKKGNFRSQLILFVFLVFIKQI